MIIVLFMAQAKGKAMIAIKIHILFLWSLRERKNNHVEISKEVEKNNIFNLLA